METREPFIYFLLSLIANFPSYNQPNPHARTVYMDQQFSFPKLSCTHAGFPNVKVICFQLWFLKTSLTLKLGKKIYQMTPLKTIPLVSMSAIYITSVTNTWAQEDGQYVLKPRSGRLHPFEEALSCPRVGISSGPTNSLSPAGKTLLIAFLTDFSLCNSWFYSWYFNLAETVWRKAEKLCQVYICLIFCPMYFISFNFHSFLVR